MLSYVVRVIGQRFEFQSGLHFRSSLSAAVVTETELREQM